MQLWHVEFCRLQLKLLRVPISHFKFNVGSRHAVVSAEAGPTYAGHANLMYLYKIVFGMF